MLVSIRDPINNAEFTNGMRDGVPVTLTGLTTAAAFGTPEAGGVKTAAATEPAAFSAATTRWEQPANAQQAAASIDVPMSHRPKVRCDAGMVVLVKNPHASSSTGAITVRLELDVTPAFYS